MMDWSTIVMLVVVVAALYFLMIRPQQRRAKQQKEHMASLQPGSRIMTVHGIFGTIVYLGDKQAVIEVSPGVELTVLKAAISNQPVADEFEYEEGQAVEPSNAELKGSETPVAPVVAAAAAVAATPVVAEAVAAEPEPTVESEPEAAPVAAAAEPEQAEQAEQTDEAEAGGTSFPDVTDDSFSSWWDEHFPKN